MPRYVWAGLRSGAWRGAGLACSGVTLDMILSPRASSSMTWNWGWVNMGQPRRDL